MMLKIVYGPPPEDMERIESLTLKQYDEIRETDTVEFAQPDISQQKQEGKTNELG